MRIRSCLLACLVCIAVGFAGGIAVGIPTKRELGDVRQSLDATRERSAELERRLRENESLARSSAERINDAIGEAGRIKDAGKRIVYLVGEIRAIVGVLRTISGSGEAAP